jgi:hypothetical protein
MQHGVQLAQDQHAVRQPVGNASAKLPTIVARARQQAPKAIETSSGLELVHARMNRHPTA